MIGPQSSKSFSKDIDDHDVVSEGTTTQRRPRISRWALQELAEVCDDQVCTQEIQALPQFAHEDIEVQGLLGEGGFSSVFQVKILNSEDGAAAGPLLAMKQLRRYKRGREEEDWVLAVYDLCNETSLLARLAPHENIVTIMGVCKTSVSSAYKNHVGGYFFVMEKLEETLGTRLNSWRQELKQSTGRFSRLRRSHSSPSISSKGSSGSRSDPDKGGSQLLSSQAVYQRLNDVAIGIARAMSHLHSADFQIALRDLKPANIGFDENGTVKLFDFGMARPVHETDTAELAGTFRYISPEAIMGHRIGLESDVYSFGVIFYELVTLLRPFDQYFHHGKLVRKDAFVDNVIVGGSRPSLSGIPCRATRRLIAKCWDPSPRARPCFDRIYFLLNRMVSANSNDTETEEDSNPQSSSTTTPGRLLEEALLAPSTESSKPKSSRSTAVVESQQHPRLERIETQTPVGGSVNLSPFKKSRSSIRGLFRHLNPLPKQSKRICSDITAETTSSSIMVNSEDP